MLFKYDNGLLHRTTICALFILEILVLLRNTETLPRFMFNFWYLKTILIYICTSKLKKKIIIHCQIIEIINARIKNGELLENKEN